MPSRPAPTAAHRGPSTGETVMRTVYMGFLAFALLFAFAPRIARRPFDLLFYGGATPGVLSEPEAAAALDIYAAVIGGVMAGWLVPVVMLLWRNREEDRRIVLASLACWYVVDSAGSILAGFWQNAVSNTGFLIVLLAALRAGAPRGFRPSG